MSLMQRQKKQEISNQEFVQRDSMSIILSQSPNTQDLEQNQYLKNDPLIQKIASQKHEIIRPNLKMLQKQSQDLALQLEKNKEQENNAFISKNQSLLDKQSNKMFYQDKYLRKVDKVEDHINQFTLYFHNQDYENEWRIQEINARKGFIFFTFFIKIGGDIIWTWTPDFSFANQVQAGISDIIFLAVIFKIYYRQFNCKLFNQKKQTEVLMSESEEEQDEFRQKIKKLEIEKQSKDMIKYYFLWWLIWSAERLPNSFDQVPDADKNNHDPQNLLKYAGSLAEIYFFLAIDLFSMCLVIVMTDINWIPHSLILIFYGIIQIFHIIFYFESLMLQSYILATVLIFSCMILNNYYRIKASKHQFLQSKKIKMLLKQQLQIFQNLPDGAIIYKYISQSKKNEIQEEKRGFFKFGFKNSSKSDLQIVPQDTINIELRYLNITFKEMFSSYKKELQKQELDQEKNVDKNLELQNEITNKADNLQDFKQRIKVNQIEEPYNIRNEDSEVGILHEEDIKKDKKNPIKEQLPADDKQEEELDSNDFSYLNNVYLQKINFKIKGDSVKQGEDITYQPMSLVDSIKSFEDGQVYKVLTKDKNGQLVSLKHEKETPFAERVANQLKGSQQKADFLIYVVNQEILFDDEVSTITYFRDITFGILYEQVKAEQQIQDMISKTLNSKMGEPLATISANCKLIEDSKSLEIFEKQNQTDKSISQFRNQVRSARVFTELMIYQLKDMQDLQDLKKGQFRKNSQKFNLQDCLQEIKDMMDVKAKLKNLSIGINFCEFKKELIEMNDKMILKQNEFSQTCPLEVIGDQERIKQVAINLIQNSISKMYHGVITLDIKYSYLQQKLRFEVKDTGIGIQDSEQQKINITFQKKTQQSIQDQEKEQQQENQDSNQGLGLGLKISHLIVSSFNGIIDYQSEVRKGSTFYFTFDLQDANNQQSYLLEQEELEFKDKEISSILPQNQVRKTSIAMSLIQKNLTVFDIEPMNSQDNTLAQTYYHKNSVIQSLILKNDSIKNQSQMDFSSQEQVNQEIQISQNEFIIKDQQRIQSHSALNFRNQESPIGLLLNQLQNPAQENFKSIKQGRTSIGKQDERFKIQSLADNQIDEIASERTLKEQKSSQGLQETERQIDSQNHNERDQINISIE